jgi:hypothetical protein
MRRLRQTAHRCLDHMDHHLAYSDLDLEREGLQLP